MEYKGELYGKVGKSYFPLQETSEDFDSMKKALQEFVSAVENEEIILKENIDHDGFASTPERIYNIAKKALKQ